MKRAAYIGGGSAWCAAGAGIEAVWAQLASGSRTLSDLPCPAFESWPWPQVFMTPELSAAELGVDRKVMRTMEKQAALALHGAALALNGSDVLQGDDKSRVGLYLGLSTVEDPSPTWPALEELQSNPAASLSVTTLRELPPFFCLTQLNSSACAHIAGKFGMTGAMGAYSPFADAGLQALIEGALSLDDGENDAALVGGVSQKINPWLLVQFERLGWAQRATHIPGEGSAFALLQATPPAGLKAIRLSGYARGFAADNASPKAYAAILSRALVMAGISAGDIGWVLGSSESAGEQVAIRALFGTGGVAQGSCRAASGVIGPAEPLLNVMLAAHGMQQGKRLRFAAPGATARGVLPVEEQVALRHVLITAEAPEGQYVAVILSTEAA